MTEGRNILILGAGYAGLMAAMRIRTRLAGQDVAVTVIDGLANFRERVRLHQVVVGQSVKQTSLKAFLEPAGIQFQQGWVRRFDADKRQVVLEGPSGELILSYDRLIYALGSQTDKSTPGVAEHAFTLDHGDVDQICKRINALTARQGKVTVVGAGGTGLEIAAELAESFPDLRVTLVSQSDVGAFLSAKGKRYAVEVLSRLGIKIYANVRVAAVTPGEAQLETGAAIDHDLCIWTAGFAAPTLAREAGLAVNDLGQIQVNERLQSLTDKYIYAAGDGAIPVANVGAPVRMSLYTALFMGAYVADAVAASLQGKVAHPFSFSYIAMGISLGRQQGLVQFLSANQDRPLNFILRGRLAMLFKEFFTHFGLWAIRLQRYAPGAFYWLGKGKWRRLPTAAANTIVSVKTT